MTRIKIPSILGYIRIQIIIIDIITRIRRILMKMTTTSDGRR